MRGDRLDCEQVLDRLALVPGADLLPEHDAAVRSHLAACATCRRELGSYLRARRALRTLSPESMTAVAGGQPGVAGSPEFFATLQRDTLAAVRREGVSPRGSWWARSSVARGVRRMGRRSAAIMTAAALFLLGIYLVPQWLPRTSLDLPRIRTEIRSQPAWSVKAQFRDLGYGLSGHQPMCGDRIRLVPPEEVPGSDMTGSGSRPR